eukprot:PhF_6_TR29222/c0_g1_i3/m.42761
MMRDHFAWRVNEKINEMLEDEMFDPSLSSTLYPCGFFGVDSKQHNPIWCEAPGTTDPHFMMKTYTMETLVRWHIAIMETGKHLLLKSKDSKGVTVIMNTAGIGMSFRVAIPFVKALGAVDQANYPEHLDKLYILNTGRVTRILYDLIKYFIDERTRSKVVLLGDRSAYEKVLVEAGIDLDRIPLMFGGRGTAEVPSDDPIGKVVTFGCLDSSKAKKYWGPAEVEQKVEDPTPSPDEDSSTVDPTEPAPSV